MMRCAVIIVMLAIALSAGCKREERNFRGAAPTAQAMSALRLSRLQPGATIPDVEVHSEYEGNAYALNEGKTFFSAFNCVGCHAPGLEGFEKSGLDLTTWEGVMKGTKFGPMVIPKDPDSSNLVWLLDWRGSLQTRMPHGKKKLSTCDRTTIRTWIREGAKNN